MKIAKKDFYNFKANNDYVLQEWEKAYNEMISETHYDFRKLRHCSAEVFETENYIFLRSYRTVVAFIEKSTGNFFDVLRYVYGYTATSAQHISKFWHDYPNNKRFCYYDI